MRRHTYVHADTHRCVHTRTSAWWTRAACMDTCTLVRTPVYSLLHTHTHWRCLSLSADQAAPRGAGPLDEERAVL